LTFLLSSFATTRRRPAGRPATRALALEREAGERIRPPDPGRDTENLRGAFDAVHPAAAGRQRLFDLLALTAGATLSGTNNIGTEAGKLEIGNT
jgi:hypothetical protein